MVFFVVIGTSNQSLRIEAIHHLGHLVARCFREAVHPRRTCRPTFAEKVEATIGRKHGLAVEVVLVFVVDEVSLVTEAKTNGVNRNCYIARVRDGRQGECVDS